MKRCKFSTRCRRGKLLAFGSGSSIGVDAVCLQVVMKDERMDWIDEA